MGMRQIINKKTNQENQDIDHFKKGEISSGEMSRITPYSTSANCSRISFQNTFSGVQSSNFTPTIQSGYDKCLGSYEDNNG